METISSIMEKLEEVAEKRGEDTPLNDELLDLVVVAFALQCGWGRNEE